MLEKEDARNIESVIRNNPDIFDETFKGYTFASYAIIQNNDPLTKLILKYADFERRDSYGRTLLHTAIIINNLTAFEILLDNDINLEAIDNKGNKALFYSLDLERLKMVIPLLRAGADIENTNDGDNLLIRMIEKKQDFVVNTLLKFGANVKNRSKDGELPIEIAYNITNKKEQGDCFKKLVEYGADATGYLERSLRDNKIFVFVFLLSQGANPNAKIDGVPMITYATKRNLFPFVRALIKFDAND